MNGRYKDDYDFQIDIKTKAEDGIIFYTSDLNKKALIALYVSEGKVRKPFRGKAVSRAFAMSPD